MIDDGAAIQRNLDSLDSESYKIQQEQVQSPATGKEESPATARAGSSSGVKDPGSCK